MSVEGFYWKLANDVKLSLTSKDFEFSHGGIVRT